MSFRWPLLLIALALVPLAFAAYLLLERRRARFAVRFTNLEVLAAVAGHSASWRRWVPPALFLLALALALTALARPRVNVSVARQQASIVVTIDSSGSMLAEDVKPTRLAAAQEAVRRFLERLPKQYRVSLVTFSSETFVLTPLTHDRELVREALLLLSPGMGTAIGDAVARSVEVGREGETAPEDGGGPGAPADAGKNRPLTAIVMLSDGFQTRGTLQPLEGAQRAKSFGIPVYTVALGTPEGEVTFDRGPYTRTIPVPPDKPTMKRIARLTGGQFFEARSGDRLNAVYESLGSRLGRTRELREATSYLLGGSALLLLGAGLLSVRWLQRLP
ncbi:MAG: VWA domain-containing protein [Gaiellaceae bacterium]